eukprot:evm.model.scf_2382.1 EVM.evm.TU.scf_2382.1   scf_2382:19981-20461(-)
MEVFEEVDVLTREEAGTESALAEFGRSFGIDLTNIPWDEVSEAFSDVVAVQLDTKDFDSTVWSFVETFADRYSVSPVVFLYNLLHKLSVCLPRASVVIGAYDRRSGKMADNPAVHTPLVLWLCGLGDSGSGNTFTKELVADNFGAALAAKQLDTPSPIKN